jgi:hypothetical protein
LISNVQLDEIGIRNGFLPHGPPFALQTNGDWLVSGTDQEPTFDGQRTLSNSTFIRATASMEGFMEVYSEVSQHAIAIYDRAGRKRFASKVRDKLSSLERCVQSFLWFPYPLVLIITRNHQSAVSVVPASKERGRILRHTWPYLEAFSQVISEIDSNRVQNDEDRLKLGELNDIFRLCTLVIRSEEVASLVKYANSTDVASMLAKLIEGASTFRDGTKLGK